MQILISESAQAKTPLGLGCSNLWIIRLDLTHEIEVQRGVRWPRSPADASERLAAPPPARLVTRPGHPGSRTALEGGTVAARVRCSPQTTLHAAYLLGQFEHLPI